MATLVKLVMLAIAAGIAYLVAVKSDTDGHGNVRMEIKPGGALIGVLIVALALGFWPAFGYIPVGHRGIIVGTKGVVMVDGPKGPVGRVLGEGFYTVVPFLNNVEILSVQTEAFTADAEAASSDLQDVKAKIVINYRLNPENVWRVYQQLGSNFVTKVFSPAIQEAVKASTAKFDAEDLIQKRAQVAAEIRKVLDERGEKFGFEVQAVSIVDFNFSPEFNKAIELKAKATQDAETARRIREKVRAEQESKVLEYQADATRRKLELEAQAAGQKAQLQYITHELIELRKAEATLEFARKWNGQMPQWVSGGNLTTLLQVSPPDAKPAAQGR